MRFALFQRSFMPNTAAVFCSLLSVVCRPAQALADTDPPFGVAIGVYVPNSPDIGTQKAWPTLDLRYTLPRREAEYASSRTVLGIGVQIDRYSQQRVSGNSLLNGTSSGTDVLIPLTVSQVFRLSGRSPLASHAAFAGLGVGATLYVGFGAGANVLGYAELGYNASTRLFVDAKYYSLGGVQLTTGLRF